MKKDRIRRWLWPGKPLSPRGCLLRAAVLAAFFLFAHLAGWREATTALSGTAPSATGSQMNIMQGLLYVLAFLGFTVAVPILILSAVFLKLFEAGAGGQSVSASSRRRFRPSLALVYGGNAVLTFVFGLYLFFLPGIAIVARLHDGSLWQSDIPPMAWTMHRRLSPAIEGWARERVVSGAAARVDLADVAATEWPLFGSVFYLWATEALQTAWENDATLAPVAPRDYARGAIEASVALVMDPAHHAWVRERWGSRYMQRENLFFRKLVIAAALGHERLIGDGRYLDSLRDQTLSLSAELDASPHGLLDDYPGECYPLDILAAIAVLREAHLYLGLDPSGFVERSRRAFEGDQLDALGLIPFSASARTGRVEEPSRGVVHAWAGVFARELYPDKADLWQTTFEQHFWQEGVFAGYREFLLTRPNGNWTFDVDAGPILGGYGPAANAFGYASARVNGRMDLARTLGEQMLIAFWPLPGGRLLGARLLSVTPHAPFLGESALLYALTRTPAPDVELRTGGRRMPSVWLGLFFFFGMAALHTRDAVKRLRQWRKNRNTPATPRDATQAVVWLLLLTAAALLFALSRAAFGLVAFLLALSFPFRFGRSDPGFGSRKPRMDAD